MSPAMCEIATLVMMSTFASGLIAALLLRLAR